ncbi:MAG: class I SAM-dependent methyltransferase [Candidatus Sungbacteria bacterium]|nr:class I SAM-dependent methyltransferase [Candidatus Sungbacteria bacterium]
MSLSLRETYDRIAEDYSRDHAKDTWGYDFIKESLSSLPRSARVLDIGCGPGNECGYLKALGYAPVGVDFSEAMIRIARLRHPTVPFQVTDITELASLPGSFEAAIARSSLLHLKKPQVPAALKEIVRLLMPGGVFYCAVKEGEDEKEVTESDYGYPYTRFFSYFMPEELLALLETAGLHIKRWERLEASEAPRIQVSAVKP